MPAFTIVDLISNVLKAYADVPSVSLDNVFVTLQTVLECILENSGDNKYSLKHIGKEALRRRGELEESLKWSADAYLSVRMGTIELE